LIVNSDLDYLKLLTSRSASGTFWLVCHGNIVLSKMVVLAFWKSSFILMKDFG